MVSVPVTPGRSVQVQAQPRERFNYAESRNYFGRALEQAGGTLGQAAQDLDAVKRVYDTAAAKRLDVYAADRKREILWDGDDAFFKRQGLDAEDGRADLEKKFADLRADVLSRAGNDRQRRMLTDSLDRQFDESLTAAARYATGQSAAELERQSIARRSQFQQSAVALYNDPKAYADNIAGGLIELGSIADQQGWSDERLDDEEQKFVSGIHTATINGRLAADDVDGALALLGKYRDDMTFADAQAVEAKMQPAIQYRQAEDDALVALGAVPTAGPDDAPTPSVASDLYSQLKAIESNESGGKQFTASGKPLTSSKGAIGVMQVMPSTGPEAARYAGLAWDPKRFREDEDYNRALGAAYYKEMLRRFGGDPVKAAAAYNAGPGSARKGTGVNGAIAKATKAGEPDNWVAYLPAETKDYVAKFQRKTGAASSGGSSPRKWDLTAAYTALEDRAKREGWTPERLERARQRVDERVKRDEMLEGRQESEEWDRALGTVDSLGDAFTDVNQVPNYGNLPADRRLQLRNMADANKRAVLAGDAPKAGGDIATALEVMAIEQPEKFLSVDLREYRSQMTPGEYSSLQTKAATIRAKPQEEIAFRGAISGTISAFATPDMNLDGKKNEGRRAKVTGIMETWLRGHVKPGVQPTQSQLMEAMRFATGNIVKPATGIKGALFGGETETPRANLPVFDVPPDILQAFVRGYRAETGRTPTDDQIVDWWDKNKGRYQ